MKNTIYMVGSNVPVRKAIRIMTNDWVDAGNSCPATVISMRNALRHAIKQTPSLFQDTATIARKSRDAIRD